MSLDTPTAPATANGVAGQLVYAIGDIHGCYDLLKELLAQVVADCQAWALGRRPVLVFLGDYVDRGPDSAKVLEALVWLRRRSEFEVHLLKGNHEQALLQFIQQPERAYGWLEYGGAATLDSYGVTPPMGQATAADYVAARDALVERMPASHLRLLETLELMVVVGDYAFVHAGVRPGRPLRKQQEEDLLWIRQGFVDATGPFEKTIVHGHTWASDQPELWPHRLGLDTGAYATGVLTAARLQDGRIGLLQARRPKPDAYVEPRPQDVWAMPTAEKTAS